MNKLYFTFISWLISSNLVLAQPSEWLLFKTSNSQIPTNQVHSIAIDKNDVKWIGTASGLARYDGTTWKIFNCDNSPLPSSMIRCVRIDLLQNVWIGTDKGLAKFNGTDWLIYNSSNSILTNDAITTMAMDIKTGVIWIGTEKGLVKYDGKNWSRFDENNSNLVSDFICSIAIDKTGSVWAGSFDHFQFAGRLNRYDGTSWINFRLEQRGLNSSFPVALAVDDKNILWMATKGTSGGSLVRIDGPNWQVYNTENGANFVGGLTAVIAEGNRKWISTGSRLIRYEGAKFEAVPDPAKKLHDQYVYALATDKKGNKWIGTINGGLIVYNQGGIIPMDETPQSDPVRIFPNPVHSSATISYVVSQPKRVTITVYNSAGRLVGKIQDRFQDKGQYQTIWDVSIRQAGVYYCTISIGSSVITRPIVVTRN